MNRSFFYLFLASVLLSTGANPAISEEVESAQSTADIVEQSASPSKSGQTTVRRPKPTFFEESRKIELKGFKKRFLIDALNGTADPLAGIGGSGTGGFSPEFRGESNPNFIPTGGIFSGTVLTNSDIDPATFTPTNPAAAGFGPVVITNVNTTSRTATISVDGRTSTGQLVNFGNSGTGGFATVVTNDPVLGNFRITGQNLRDRPGTFTTGGTLAPGGLAPDR